MLLDLKTISGRLGSAPQEQLDDLWERYGVNEEELLKQANDLSLDLLSEAIGEELSDGQEITTVDFLRRVATAGLMGGFAVGLEYASLRDLETA